MISHYYFVIGALRWNHVYHLHVILVCTIVDQEDVLENMKNFEFGHQGTLKIKLLYYINIYIINQDLKL